MGKGDYKGGSTLIRKGSDWFSYRPAKDKPLHLKKLARDQRPISVQIEEAAEKLAAAKAEYDRGEWTKAPTATKVRRRNRKKPKPKAE